MGQSSVKPEGYLPRIVDEQVERYLRIFGAVEIEGTKWCGKTWTARQHGASISYVDEQLALAQDDPSLMLLGEKPHIIDEWQRVPAIWNLVRHGIDETRGLRGGWILTGSSTPPDRQGDAEAAKRHSGAGRIGRIKMSPMTLSESGDSENHRLSRSAFRGTSRRRHRRGRHATARRTSMQGRLARSARPGRPGCADDSSRVSDRRMP